MTKIVRNIIILCCLLLGFGFQPTYDTSAKIKAVFLYNFTRYFEWPDNMEKGNFLIQIVGSNKSLMDELAKMATVKKVDDRKIEIKSNEKLDLNSIPNMLFLLPESSSALKDISSKLKGKGTLIITENKGLTKVGSAINFVVVDNKQKFEYNKSNAVKAGLDPSEEFKTLAVNIE